MIIDTKVLIDNRQCRIKRSHLDDPASLPDIIEESLGPDILRWYIAQVLEDEVLIETTAYAGELSEIGDVTQRRHHPGKSVLLNVIPTGIGCSIGGYAGDAAPVTNLLATTVDYLVTNPNAVNASDFIGLDSSKIVYAEGSCIDLFCRGAVDLHIPYMNRIGLIIEKTSDRRLDVIFNVINAVRAVHGVEIVDCLVTDRPIGGRSVENRSGAFVGTVDNPDVLLQSCDRLLKKGATAIAITSDIQDLPFNDYAKHFAGEYPNPTGGVEAVMSYLVTRTFQVPAAHAPLINIKELDLANNIVDARGAGEFASESGLACILVGLAKAPQIKPVPDVRISDIINLHNLLAIITPASALGGVPAIYGQRFNIPVIAVEENQTIFDVTQSQLNLNNIIHARSYLEAAGVILALKKGISLESLQRPLKTYKY